MEKKIKLYSIVLALVYFSMLIFSFYEGIDDFITGYKMGREGKRNIEIHHFKVTPEAGDYSFPEEIKNLKTGKLVDAEPKEYIVQMQAPYESHSALSYSIKITQSIMAFFFIFIFIRIPILFFNTIRSVIKGEILMIKNIKRIAAIGWFLIAYYVLDLTLYNIGEAYIAQQLVQIEGYNITFSFSDSTALILGIVTLLFAEILKLSLRMKEEQDLTI